MKTKTRNPYFQHTLAKPIYFAGRGLHSGKTVAMTLQPALANTGYVFERLDVDIETREIPARWHTVTETRLSTRISNAWGVSVSTIEHIMAALFASGVDNCRILLDGEEVPIMDGSAKPFVRQIESVGLQQQKEERRALVITQPVWVYDRDKYAGFLPYPQQHFDMTIDFESSVIGKQNYSMPLDADFFDMEIAEARTFGFENQIETLKKLGLVLGGSLQNAVLVNDAGVVNEEGLRFKDEFVRHKLLDAVGDLSLAGAVIFGRFIGHCSGHGLNNRLLRSLLQHKNQWKYTTVREATEQWADIMDVKTYGDVLESAIA